MTTSILFIKCPAKMGFYRLQNEHYFNKKKHIADTDVVKCTCKVLLHVWSYDFYDMTLSTE